MSLKIAPVLGALSTGFYKKVFRLSSASNVSLETKNTLHSNGHIVILIVGPFASGKDTIVNKLMQDSSLEIAKPVRYTTRGKRDKEIDGKDYHFVSKEVFEETKDNGEFIQADDYGYCYGTSIKSLQDLFDDKKDAIFSIGCDDAEKLKIELIKNRASYVEIFISPVSKEILSQPGGVDKAMEILEKRMSERGRDPDYELRVVKSRRWLSNANNYTHIIKNPDGGLNQTLEDVIDLINNKKSEH